MRNISEIDSMAINLRKELVEDSMSPIDIFSMAKTMPDLTTVLYPLGSSISGMCIKGKGINLIAINSGMSLGRQRFSMAHEFYHLRYDTEVKKSVCSTAIDGGDEKEREADMFASHFLLPSAALYNVLKDSKTVSLEQVVWLEQHFGLSRQAILYRLKSEGKIDSTLYNKMQVDVQYSASKLGYDTDLYKATPKSSNMKTTGQYIRMADELYSGERISTGKYEEILLDAFREDLVFGDDEEGDEIID
ncbi:MAG: ImmA/IrrE family metallo-endopeptidase [Lachnospiraceae bacterium]|nr:ImmA/IrrE family metallo-endopeptidase [Lachnospiraceae bacterium]